MTRVRCQRANALRLPAVALILGAISCQPAAPELTQQSPTASLGGASRLETAAPAPTGPGAESSDDLEGITQEDYEEEAVIDISAETLEAELDRLEREIGD